jgi:hypothetical protein
MHMTELMPGTEQNSTFLSEIKAAPNYLSLLNFKSHSALALLPNKTIGIFRCC